MEHGPQLPPLAGGMPGGGAYGNMMKPTGAIIQSYPGAGGQVHQVMDCAKAFVGKVIGKGGETIMLIQQRSGAKVQIDQSVPEGQPCKINMSGMPQNLAIATQMIQVTPLRLPRYIYSPPRFTHIH